MGTDRLCEGRVCIVTGAGRGLGRESPGEVGPVVRKLLADARPRTLFHEVS